MPEVEWVSRGAERVIKDFDNVVKAKERDANATRGSVRATEELGRISQRILKDTETAWERYTRRVVNAKRAHDDGKIATQNLNREMANASVALLRETDAVDKQTAAQNRNLALRRQQQKIREIGRMETLRSVSAIRMETDALGFAATQLGNYAVKVNGVIQARSKASAGGGQFAAAMGRITPWLAAGAAVGASMEQDASASSQAGAQAIASGRAAAGLAELARADPKLHARLLANSRASFREGGFADEAGAHALTFELMSGDILHERKFFSKAARAAQPAAELAKTVATYRAGFAGGDDVGTSAQIVSKAIEAAANPVGVEAADILRGASMSAQAAKQLGLSDEEHLGIIDTISTVTGSADMAGNYAHSLYRAFIRRGYVDKRQKSAVELRDELANKKLVMSKLQKELGRQEAATAFSILNQPGVLEERIAAISAAQDTDLANQTFDTAIATPSVATGIAVNQMNADTQITEEAHGLRRQRIEAQTRQIRAALRKNLPGILSAPIGTLYEGFPLFGVPIPGISSMIPDALEDPGTASVNGLPPGMEDLANGINRAVGVLEEQKRNQEKALRRRPTGRRE